MRTPVVLHESAPLSTRLLEQQAGQSRGVYGVLLIKEGKGNPKDRHYYPREVIAKGARFFEGAVCFADHADRLEEQTRPERSVRDMVGWYQNVSFKEMDGKAVLAGELVTIPGPSYQWARDLMDAAIAKRQQGGGDLVGLSINASGMTSPKEIDGESWEVVEEFVGAGSIDLVTQAGAGGRIVALKESLGCLANDQACLLEQRLRGMNDPLVSPIVRALTQLREEKEGGSMAKTVLKPDSPLADELERRVKAREAEVFGKEDEEDKDKEETEEVSFADWEGGDDNDIEKRLQAIEDRLSKIEKSAEAASGEKPEGEEKAEGEEEIKAEDEGKRDMEEKSKKAEESLRVPIEVVRAVAKEAYAKAKGKDSTALLRENALLRAEIAKTREVDRARAILRENHVPPAAWSYLFEFMIGRTEKEQRRFVESYLASMTELIDRDDRVRQAPKVVAEADSDLTGALAQYDIPMVGRA